MRRIVFLLTAGCFFGSLVGEAGAGTTLLRPDLKLSISEAADPAKEYSNLVYTIGVTNSGGAADSVTIRTMLPPGTEFRSVSSSSGQCSVNREITCVIGTVPQGALGTMNLTIVPTSIGYITLSADSWSKARDSNTSDNASSETTRIVYGPIADMALQVAAGTQRLTQNGFAGITATYQNHGPDAASTGLFFMIPEGLAHVASGPGCNQMLGGGSVSCPWPGNWRNPMQPGTEWGNFLVVKALKPGTYEVKVSVGHGGFDPDTTNNSASVSLVAEGTEQIPTEPYADLSVRTTSTSIDNLMTRHSDFQVTVINRGTITAEQVKLSDVYAPYPEGTVTGLTTTQGSCSSDESTISCDLGDIAPGATVQVSFGVDSLAEFAHGNFAYVETSSAELAKTDNESIDFKISSWPTADSDGDHIPNQVESFICFARNLLLPPNLFSPGCY